MKTCWLLLAALVALGPAAAAHAGAPDPAVVEARKRFEEGSKAFNLGEFDRAITEYKAAYNAKPDPVFLYNIAQANRMKGDLGQALFFYRSFLRNSPATPNRKEIEDRIRQLEAQLAQQRAITAEPPTSTVPPGALPPSTPPPESHPAEPVVVTPTPVVSAPVVVTPAVPTPAPLTTSATIAATPRTDKPMYKKGWVWGVVVGSVLVVAGVGVGLGLGLGHGAASAPNAMLGNQKAFLDVGGPR